MALDEQGSDTGVAVKDDQAGRCRNLTHGAKGHYMLDILNIFPDTTDDDLAGDGLRVDGEEDDGDATGSD